MSCPSCGDEDVRYHEDDGDDPGKPRWALALDDGFHALKFCPFCGVNLTSPALAWTRETPKAPGYYFMLDSDGMWLQTISDEATAQDLLPADDEPVWFYGPLPIEPPAPPDDDSVANEHNGVM